MRTTPTKSGVAATTIMLTGVERRCDLVHGEPSEETEIDDLGQARTPISQTGEGFVEGQELLSRRVRTDLNVAEIDVISTASAFVHRSSAAREQCLGLIASYESRSPHDA